MRKECSSGLRNVALLMTYEAVHGERVVDFEIVTQWWLGGIDLEHVQVTITRDNVDYVNSLAYWRDKGGVSLDDDEEKRLANKEKIVVYPARVDDMDKYWDFFHSD